MSRAARQQRAHEGGGREGDPRGAGEPAGDLRRDQGDERDRAPTRR